MTHNDNDRDSSWFLSYLHPESAPVEVLHVWCASASPVGPHGTFGSEDAAAAFLDAVEPYGDATVVERIDYAHLRRRIPRVVAEGFDGDDAA
jgi:hypothetical protein